MGSPRVHIRFPHEPKLISVDQGSQWSLVAR